MPELNNLWPAPRAVSNRAEKFTYANLMTGLFHDLAPRAGDWAFIDLELAARQHPELVLRALHDGNQGARAVAHHDAARRMNGLARHPARSCQPFRLAKLLR